MKPELEEIKYIEDYLLNKLSNEEKLAFEKKIKNETEFTRRVEIQRVVMRRVQQMALKQSVNKAHKNFILKQKFSFKNSVFKYTVNIILTIIGVSLIAYAIWINS